MGGKYSTERIDKQVTYYAEAFLTFNQTQSGPQLRESQGSFPGTSVQVPDTQIWQVILYT
jgi:hypothetical protein